MGMGGWDVVQRWSIAQGWQGMVLDPISLLLFLAEVMDIFLCAISL
jgi:hypothetical protein